MRTLASLVLLLALAGCAITPPDPCTATPHSVQCQMERYTGTT